MGRKRTLKEIQLMLDGQDFIKQFIFDLRKDVKSLGGNDLILYNAIKSDSRLRKEFAKLIVKQNTSLSTLISSLKLDWINPNITEKNFPIQPEDSISKKEYKLFNFEKPVSSEKVISNMEEQEGYRPATLRELLKWGMDNWNGRDLIVALGQIWLDFDNGRDVAVLVSRNLERWLNLGRFGRGWLGGCWFLAVRK